MAEQRRAGYSGSTSEAATHDTDGARLTGRRLRIGLLGEFAYPFHKGGAERRYYELASRLAARGHEVHWFAMQDWAGGSSITHDGVVLHAACQPFDVYHKSGRRSIGAGLRLSAALTAAVLRSGLRFDLLDCSLYPFFHTFGARIVRPRTPIVISWYEHWGEHWYRYLGWRGFLGKQVERATARLPHRIIAVSALAVAGLRRDGIPENRISLIPLGVDSDAIELVPASGDGSDVVFFGRLKNHKNVDLLLRAIARVSESRPHIRCAIIGDGPERARLERLAHELGLGAAVCFYGAVEDDEMLGIVKASKVFVHPSTKEGGASITLLEANACGVPVIALQHKLGFDPWLIEPGRNGWWVPRADADLLARAIVEALTTVESDHYLNAWAERCRSFARANDFQRMTDSCEDVYLEVVERS